MTDDTRAKYEKTRVLLRGATNRGAYLHTVLPAFDEIATKLHDGIAAGAMAYTFAIGDKMLEVVGSAFPIVHAGSTPTMKDVLDAVRCHSGETEIFVFVTPLASVRVGAWRVSNVQVAVQVGKWVPTGEPGHRTGLRFPERKVAIELAHPLADPLPEPAEMARRHALVIPVKVKDDGAVRRQPELPSVADAFAVAYLWKDDFTVAAGSRDDGSGDIRGPDGAVAAKLLAKRPTFHTYAYYGFFKPALGEVLAQLGDVFVDGARYYVTTRPATEDIGQVVVGNYHVGATSVWKICERP